ncbi:MAG: hypothetical protein Ctma_1437 [Catillopecten margaritatus gill symbiont]|uniref:Transposase DDE domain-containing protein n=1 Tax=Catillopecten margaritatus gill symbiont TaxID=3083288 RepID=A0AAU6PI71_9GAMM
MQLEQEKAFLEQHNKKQYNKTDPDASLMQKPAHNLMAYNSQIVVDDKYKLIVATDITSCGTDINQLHKMAKQTKAILATDSLTIVADTGYDNHQQIKQCYDDGITPIIPGRNLVKVQQNKGKFSRDKFVYNADIDNYICPNNKILAKQNQPQTKPNGKINFGYATRRKDCKQCPLKSQCLPDKTLMKRIYRWEHQVMLDKHYDKMQTKEAKTTIKRRGSIVEHPFGTIKRGLGWDRYLVRGKEKVSGENALIMFSYNFKRVINILGVTGFIAMTLALETGNIDTFLVNFWQNFIFSGLFIVVLLNIANSLNIKQNRRYLFGKYLKIVIFCD